MKSKAKALLATKWSECVRQASITSVKYRKLRYYNLFKNKFETVKYLVHLKDFSLRQQVAKFRCSDHNLMIEVGRHKNIALENRTCTKCSANCIEDEVHLLIDCRGVSPGLRVFHVGRIFLLNEKIFRTKLTMKTFVNSSLLLI